MTNIDLPAPIAAYVAASNAHDARGATAVFAADAIVHDEGEDHAGASAILRWKTDATAKYKPVVEPLAFAANEDGGVLTGSVSGNFPGSPVTLRYAFTLTGGKIARLTIAS